MVAQDLIQRGRLIGHRAGFIVQKPGGIPPAAHRRRQPAGIKLHGVLVHNSTQHHRSVLQGRKARRQMQRLFQGRVVDKRHGEAVAGHAAGVDHVPLQKCRQLQYLVGAGDDPCLHGITTVSPG